jgi:putative membrane protein
VPFSFDPGPIALIILLECLYLRAVRVLDGRGYEVPFWQQFAWHSGVGLMAFSLLGPLDVWAKDLMLSHMGQHLIIADLSAPLFLIGIRSPVYAFILPKSILVPLARRKRLRAVLRWLRQPLVAIPIWIAILYGWHFRFAFQAALGNDWVHLAQHWSFMLGAVLVWWSVIEPKKRRLPGDLWKVPYLIAARTVGMFLGVSFMIMRSPAYPDYYGHSSHGMSPLEDQQLAGGLMMSIDVIVMLLALGFFFYRNSQEHDEAERAERAERAGMVTS